MKELVGENEFYSWGKHFFLCKWQTDVGITIYSLIVPWLFSLVQFSATR